MEKYLDITPGSLSVLGLMNDKDHQVRLLIDRELLNSQYIGCHPCINTSSVRLAISDLMERILPALHHAPTLVTL
jgi:Ala-tRNA(Pro) deacylase